MQLIRKINLLRFFAFIVALLGAMESFWFFMIATTLLQLGISMLTWILYFSLMRFLVSKRWSDNNGKEESTVR